MTKRYASHFLKTDTGCYLRLQVVEVVDGQVTHFFPLEAELQDVEWLPGVIALEQEDGRLVPYHVYPYDLTAMQPVAATRRRQLP